VTTFLSIAIAASSWTAATHEVFYVAVGNEYYQQPGFSNTHGGSRSAQKVAQWLGAAGASGECLRSTDELFISKEDVFSSIQRVLELAKETDNPFLVYYFVGHGVSEGIGWNHFSLQGNISPDAIEPDIDRMATLLISTSEIYHILEASNVPFIMLLDNCYDAEEETFDSAVFSETLSSNLQNISNVLRFFNEFHGPNAVVFSTTPGTTVPMAPDIGSPAYSVGPLARRVMIGSREKEKLTLPELLQLLSSPDLDGATKPSVHHAEEPPNVVFDFSKQDIAPNTVSATGIMRLSTENTSPAEEEEVPSVFESAPLLDCHLAIESRSGEYVGDGRTFGYTSEAASFNLLNDELNSLWIGIEAGETTWDLRIATPSAKPIEEGAYKNATRCCFDSDTSPAFEFSGDGRGCNELKAEVEVTKLSRKADGSLDKLEMRFTQYCDGSTIPLHGELSCSF